MFHVASEWKFWQSHLLVHYGHEVVVIPWGILTRLAVDCGDDHQLWLWLRKHRPTNAHLAKLPRCKDRHMMSGTLPSLRICS